MTVDTRIACRTVAAAIVLAASSTALAQSNISSVQKYDWSENAGWLNWRDSGSPLAAQGARIGTSIMSALASFE